MTASVSHACATAATADNRQHLGTFSSTTALLRYAYDASEGDVTQAVSVLRSLAFDCPRAKNALRVLFSKLAKRPGAARFAIDKMGFLSLVSEAA